MKRNDLYGIACREEGKLRDLTQKMSSDFMEAHYNPNGWQGWQSEAKAKGDIEAINTYAQIDLALYIYMSIKSLLLEVPMWLESLTEYDIFKYLELRTMEMIEEVVKEEFYLVVDSPKGTTMSLEYSELYRLNRQLETIEELRQRYQTKSGG